MAAGGIRAEGSARRGPAPPSIAAVPMVGSSPCTLMRISSESPRDASATRSVPEAQSGDVIHASPPNPRTATAIRSSSVATITRVAHLDFRAFSQTYHIIGRPSIWARGFPGRRLAPYLAGMTTATPRGGVLTGTGGAGGGQGPRQAEAHEGLLPVMLPVGGLHVSFPDLPRRRRVARRQDAPHHREEMRDEGHGHFPAGGQRKFLVPLRVVPVPGESVRPHTRLHLRVVGAE